MKRHYFYSLLLILTVLVGASAATFASALDLFKPRRFPYTFFISRHSAYQLDPGDFLQVGVQYGAAGERLAMKVIDQVQVLQMGETGSDMVRIRVLLTRREFAALQKAMMRQAASVALKIVGKQPKSPFPDAVTSDSLEDLELVDESALALQSTTPEETSQTSH
jgi:hypothetical protein